MYPSAGGHELHPSEVNSSHTAGRNCAWATAAKHSNEPATQRLCSDKRIQNCSAH